jgi:outer membrane protein assembly factor BamB
MSKTILVLALLLPLIVSAQVEQWRGPKRDGIFHETGLLKQWPEEGPELQITIDNIGKGWSSPVIYQQKLYITGLIDSLDYLFCLNMKGDIEWQTAYGLAWNQTFSDTRSTPTILDNKAYLSTGMGVVVAIDLTDGKVLWENKAFANNGGEVGTWGVSESILLVDGKAVFTTGGAKTQMVALDIETGRQVWQTKSLNDVLAYVSPILIERNGKKQIVNLTAKYLFGVNPENGEMEWHYNFFELDDSEWDNAGGVINCTTPIYHDGYLYVSSGYNHTGAKFKLNDDLSNVEFIWKDKVLDNHHGGVVLIDGVVYGSNWENNSRGNWCAICFDTGELLYEERFRNKGSIVAADGMLYIYTEQPGFVGLVKPNPDKFELISSFRVSGGSGAHWAHPVVHDGKLYIRHGEKLFVYNIKA